MSSAASKQAATPAEQKKLLQKRADLCTELLGIQKKHETDFARVDAIKAELKTMATESGENFKETIPGKGEVYVAGEKLGSFKGDFPILQIDAWKSLKLRKQDQLLSTGLVKIEATYGGKYYGAVKFKLF